jgi:hypothetical protein
MEDEQSYEIVGNDEKKFSKEFYKYWFSFKGRGGFLGLNPWLETNKIGIDVGSLAEKNGKTALESNTMLWTNTLDLYAYLTAIREGTAESLYPANDRAGTGPESYVYYGGGVMEGKVVSRILKVVYWQDKNGNDDKTAFAWKAGHFEGSKGPTGAIVPNMSKALSMNQIKIPRLEMVKMQQRLEITLNAYATIQMNQGKNWWDWKDKA